MSEATNKPRSSRKLLQVAALSTTAALAACGQPDAGDAGTDVFTVDAGGQPDGADTSTGTDVFSVDAGISVQDGGSDSAVTTDAVVGVAPQDAGPFDVVISDGTPSGVDGF